MTIRHGLPAPVLLFVPALLTAQSSAQSPAEPPAPAVTITHIASQAAPVIDGRLDDPLWRRLTPITDFWKMRPVDDEPASERTEAYLAYDERNFYLGIRAYTTEGAVRASLAVRDQVFSDDLIFLALDTFHDRRRAYIFFINPLGIQADGVVADGQNDDYTIDLVWKSEGRRLPDGYELEIAIPFRSLRFKNADVQTWGIAIGRLLPGRSEQHVWPRVDIDRNCIICQTAVLEGLQGVRPGRNVELLPTVTGVQRGERADAASPFVNGPATASAGAGVKYGITPNLTLDGTVNPDFSQVETDAGQVEVNQRFALFFPEKRPFFLEGQDLFRTPIQLVYTRNIFDPLAAAKLTGKVGRTTVALLTAVDDQPLVPRGDAAPGGIEPDRRAAFNVVRLKRDVAGRASVGLTLTDREWAGSFNRVAGLDGRVPLGDLWTVSFHGVHSETRNLDGSRLHDPAFMIDVFRNGPHLQGGINLRDIAPDFRADVGFVRRTDLRQASVFLAHQARPNGAVVLVARPSVSYRRLYDHQGVLQDEEAAANVSLQMARSTFVNAGYSYALERFSDTDFWKNRYFFVVETAPWKAWNGGVYVEQGTQINFDDVYLGWSRDLQLWSSFRPDDHLRLDLTFTKSTFWQDRGGPRVFDVNIARVRASYQVTRELYFRVIGESNTYDHTVALNGLASYQAGPGTVFYLGTDSGYERLTAGGSKQNTGRVFFFKASYLWRL